MTRTLAIVALLAGSFVAAASPAQADPIPERQCFYWTDYPFCTPEVGNPVPQKCFYWTDYPTCIPPN